MYVALVSLIFGHTLLYSKATDRATEMSKFRFHLTADAFASVSDVATAARGNERSKLVRLLSSYVSQSGSFSTKNKLDPL